MESQVELDRALFILARTHTRDDDQLGFNIVTGVYPSDPVNEFGASEYLEAWATVRKHLHMPFEPDLQKSA
jgi:hypothetical protein